jgi:hypothetical protein
VDRDVPGWRISRRRALLKKPRQHVGVREMRLVQDFERDLAFEVTVVSCINLRERARAELVIQVIAPEPA